MNAPAKAARRFDFAGDLIEKGSWDVEDGLPFEAKFVTRRSGYTIIPTEPKFIRR